MSYPVWRLYMDREALRAHEAWLASGKEGPGRLVLEDQNLQGARAPRKFPAARFVRCDLSKAAFPLYRLDEIELLDCKLDEAILRQTHLERALIDGTTFTRGDLRLVDFTQAVIRDSGFAEANLERSFFVDTKLERVSFAGARLVDAVFESTHLTDCDLRDCDLSRAETFLNLGRATRTVFERCDLRGAKFDGRRLDGAEFSHCRMDGMTGKPDIEGEYSIVSPIGVTAEDVEAAWH